MKKSPLVLIAFILFVFTGNIFVSAQNSTSARQVILAIGGKFEGGPPYSDYVTLKSYNLSTLAVAEFNTIYTQSVQDVLVSGNHAYVAAQDSVVMYDIDTYQRIAAIKDSGVNKLALYNDKLIVTKQWPITRFHVEVLDANNLGLFALVEGIPGDCGGAAVSGNYVYVAVDSGYQGVEGRLAIINATSWTLENVINFGSPAVGCYSAYSHGGYIYCVNRTPFGGGNVGSITRYDPSNDLFVTNSLGVNIGPGYGIVGNLLYLGMNSSIGSYNLDTQTIVDTTLVKYPGLGSTIEIHSVAVDYINGKFYTNLGNRTSFGTGVVYSLAGDSLASYETGINTEACAIDLRTPTGMSSTGPEEETISLYPNPVNDFIGIRMSTNGSLGEINILDLTGGTISTRWVQRGENDIRIGVSEYPAGVYLVLFRSENGTTARKFVKR
jgi:hypothetical protein